MKMRELTDASAEKWRRARRLGPVLFVVLVGVFAWGIPMGLALWGINSLLDGSAVLERLRVSLVVSCAGGAVWGAVMWFLGERAYRRWQQAHAG